MTTTWTVSRVLRDRSAALYLAAVVVSGLGTSALWLAAGVWVKDLTGSDGLAALCTFALWAPSLAGPPLGTLADRTRRKPLLISIDLLLAGLLLTLLTVDSPAGLWLLFTVLLVYGTASVVHEAAKSALVAAAVAPELLGDFNGLRTTAVEGVKLVAPLAGAGLYAAYGGPSVALLDAMTFVGAAVLYACVRVRESGPEPATSGWWEQTAEGARSLRRDARLRHLVLAGGTTMLFAGVNGALIYAVVDGLGRSPAFVGVLYAAQGAGSVAVGVASGAALRRLGARRFAVAGMALTGVAVALRAVPSDAVVVACSAAIGAGLPCVLIAALTAVQAGTPQRTLGRAVATANTLLFAPNAVGLAAGALLVELVDHRLLLVILGLGQLVVLAQSPLSPLRTASRSPSDANPA
ncbi:MFS transporter [Streptomyces griseus]|uniref:MFS transporter n=1 Tax=Streptomyces griseus TaxID=1911 RepID=UPI0005622E5C|nr:MFS transporter [Streptomyces griseus]